MYLFIILYISCSYHIASHERDLVDKAVAWKSLAFSAIDVLLTMMETTDFEQLQFLTEPNISQILK